MKQEDKDLLLRCLSMALPYGVKVEGFSKSKAESKIISLCEIVRDGTAEYANCFIDSEGAWWNINAIKPYLRSMSSMTEEEEKKYGLLCFDVSYYPKCSYELIKWLLEKHFDFIGLIQKGLAIEVTEGNNPY